MRLKKRDVVLRNLQAGMCPQEIMEIGEGQMRRLYEVAHQMLKDERVEDAVNAFVFLVTLNPFHGEYWMGLGAALQANHEYEGAIDAYELAAIYNLENPLPYFYMAKCLFAVHDRVSALQACEIAIEYAGDAEEFAALKEDAIKARKTLLKSA